MKSSILLNLINEFESFHKIRMSFSELQFRANYMGYSTKEILETIAEPEFNDRWEEWQHEIVERM